MSLGLRGSRDTKRPAPPGGGGGAKAGQKDENGNAMSMDKSTFGKRHHGTAVRQYSCMRTAVQPALLRVLGYKLSRRMSARIA
eukprot:SAG25_NODE_53_length_18703_cov_126.779104_1_plen_83_part_00